MHSAPPIAQLHLSNLPPEGLRLTHEYRERLKACGIQVAVTIVTNDSSMVDCGAHPAQAQLEQPQTPQTAVMPQNPTSNSPPSDSLPECYQRSDAMIAASPASLRQLVPPTSITTFRSRNCRPCDLAAALDDCRSGRELCSRVNLDCLENIERALRRWRRRDGSPEMRIFVVTALARVKHLKSCP